MADVLERLRDSAKQAYESWLPLLNSVKILHAQSDHTQLLALIDAALEMQLSDSTRTELRRCRERLSNAPLTPPIEPDLKQDALKRLNERTRLFESLIEWLWVVASLANEALVAEAADGDRSFAFVELRALRRAYLRRETAYCPHCDAAVEFRHSAVLGPKQPPVDVWCDGCGRSSMFPLEVQPASPWKIAVATSAAPGRRNDVPPLAMRTSEDPEVVAALASVSPDIAACYSQALRDIGQSDRESFVGPAAALRELVSNVLRSAAPDAEVTAEPGFKPETTDRRPTRGQRVRYVVRKKQISTPLEMFDRALDGLDKIVTDTYSRASKATHLGATGRKEIATLADYVHGILRDLLL